MSENVFAVAAERLRRKPRTRAPRKYLLSPVRAAQYAEEAVAMVLLASVDTFGGALALGLFAGLCYARQHEARGARVRGFLRRRSAATANTFSDILSR